MMQVFGGYNQLLEAPAHYVQLMVQVWQAEMRAKCELNQRQADKMERQRREMEY